MRERTSICVIDVEEKKLVQKVPLRLSRGYWQVLAWQPMSDGEGGSFWLYTNNEKSNADRRDATLWRVDYYSNVRPRSKKRELLIRHERMTEDRVITGVRIYPYTDAVLAVWGHGRGIKLIEPLRCVLFSNGEDGEVRHDVAALASTFPHHPAGTVWHMGRTLEAPAHPKLPEAGFEFAGRYCAVFEIKDDDMAFPSGYEIGEIKVPHRARSMRSRCAKGDTVWTGTRCG
ncbi:hypothetical protein NK8_42110 [Caballeronia sp. NK8]|nr:hypothetical protein NK8_42110 [Caballeronia sp. NK8]